MSKKGRNHRKKARRRSRHPLRAEDASANLLEWMTANGFKLHRQLCVREFPETGRGLAAQQKLTAGETFLRVPTWLLITTSTALSGNLHSFLMRHHQQLTPTEVLTLFLMNEKLRGLDSEWRFFIDSLPAAYTTPVFLGSRLLARLPEAMCRKAEAQVSRIRSTFIRLQILLKRASLGDSKLLSLSENFTWHLFVWAWTAVNTRCIFSKHRTGHSLWDDDYCALAPFLDCLNHHWKADVETAVVGSYFEIVTNNNYEPNDQVFISYGSHDNKTLLLEYGFVLADNPNDVVAITNGHLYELSLQQKDVVLHFASKLLFLEEKDIISDTCGFTVDGLTWNGKIVVQVLSHPKASRSEWNNLLFQCGEQELDQQQSQLVVALIQIMLCDYSTPLPEGKDWCSQTVAAFIKEETEVLKKQLYVYTIKSLSCA
ncbi:hypothetical protein V5799_021020 [Amblyomma americanum]|uniref:SET domain-containing protein n=1 Tax=Amblyomma americanum TaxID=6943 RepID=A0AAQ4FU50_AMBAM